MKAPSIWIQFCKRSIWIISFFSCLVGLLTVLGYHPYWELPYFSGGVSLFLGGVALSLLTFSFRFPIHKIIGLCILFFSVNNFMPLLVKGYTPYFLLYFPYETACIYFVLGILLIIFPTKKITSLRFVVLAFFVMIFFFVSLEAMILSTYLVEGRYLLEKTPVIRPITAFVNISIAVGLFLQLVLFVYEDISLFRKTVHYVVFFFFICFGGFFSLRIWLDQNITMKQLISYYSQIIEKNLILGIDENVEHVEHAQNLPPWIKKHSEWLSIQVYNADLQLEEKKTKDLRISENQPVFLLSEDFTQSILSHPFQKAHLSPYFLPDKSSSYLILFVPTISEKSFQGGMAVLINFSEFFESRVTISARDNFTLIMTISDILCYAKNNQNDLILKRYLKTYEFAVYGINLTLSIGPTQNYLLLKDHFFIFAISLVGGFFISMFAGTSTYFWQKNKNQLEYIQEIQSQLEMAISSADIGVWKLNIEDNSFVLSEESRKFLGLSQDLSIVSFEDIKKSIHPEDKDTFEKEIRIGLEEGSSFFAIFKVIWPDHSVHHILGKAKKFQDVLYGAITDVSPLQEALEKVRQSEKKYRTLVETITEWFWELDVKGKFTYSNSYVESILGYLPEQIVGAEYHLFIQEENRKELDAIFDRCLLKKEGFIDYSMQMIHKDGSRRWVETKVTLIFSVQNECIGMRGVSRDITERKKIEIFKKDFVSNINHDLRTPLTAIYGALSLVIKKYPEELTVKVKDLLEIAHRNSQRLLLLVHQLLELQTIEAAKFNWNLTVFPIKDIVLDAMQLNSLIAKTVDIHICVEEPLSESFIKADYERLMEVLSNLISNAIKFSSPHQTITLSTLDKGDFVRVLVRDEGIGISKSFYPNVFSRFSHYGVQSSLQGMGMGMGMGIGLSLCKAIIEDLGGAIGFTSEEKKGSVFYFDLPKHIG